jgi:hypothetical protein
MDSDNVTRSSAITRLALTRDVYNGVDETGKRCLCNTNFRVKYVGC